MLEMIGRDERLWIIRTFNRADLPMTDRARNGMRRAEMLALGHAQRLLRGDCAGGQWIRVADRLLYIVRDRWLLVYQFAIAFLPSRTIEPFRAVVMEGGPDRVQAMIATHGGCLRRLS